MSEHFPSVLLVSRGDPNHVSAAAKLARAGLEVVTASPADLVDRMLITLSSDVIIIDHGLDEEIIVLLRRLATFNRDTLRVVVGGDPADTHHLRESGVVHHHVASLDPETLIPLLRGDEDEDDGVRAGEEKVDGEAG